MMVPGYVENASFACRRGEILGFGGLIGAGRTELFEGLVGLRPGQRHGHARRQATFISAMRAKRWRPGIVYLPKTARAKACCCSRTCASNLTLAALEKFTRGSFIDVAAEEQALDKAIGDFDIRTRRRDLLAGQLSGGNQQKLLLAKMMLAEPRIVIIDEPTRGVDIGTKEQIYRFIAVARRAKAAPSSSSPPRCRS